MTNIQCVLVGAGKNVDRSEGGVRIKSGLLGGIETG